MLLFMALVVLSRVLFHFRLLGHSQSQIAMPRFRRQFNSKEEAVMFFCEKNICDKKPQNYTKRKGQVFSGMQG